MRWQMSQINKGDELGGFARDLPKSKGDDAPAPLPAAVKTLLEENPEPKRSRSRGRRGSSRGRRGRSRSARRDEKPHKSENDDDDYPANGYELKKTEDSESDPKEVSFFLSHPDIDGQGVRLTTEIGGRFRLIEVDEEECVQEIYQNGEKQTPMACNELFSQHLLKPKVNPNAPEMRGSRNLAQNCGSLPWMPCLCNKLSSFFSGVSLQVRSHQAITKTMIAALLWVLGETRRRTRTQCRR